MAPHLRAAPVTTIRHWPLLLGIAALAIPTLVSLARQHWSTEGGAHGPIILATGLWLFWRKRQEIVAKAAPRSLMPVGLLVVPLLLLYVFGRTFNVLSIETSTLYAILVLLAFIYLGPAVMRRLLFPTFYMAFLISPPSSLLIEFTQPLKIWISDISVNILYALNYPVGRSGAIIQIDHYELRVEQACAGLNSIFSLLVFGLLYTYLSRDRSVTNIASLLVAIIPVAILANCLRVIFLVLLTYYFGDGVAQGFTHGVAGIVTFILAIIGLFAVETTIARARLRPGRNGS